MGLRPRRRALRALSGQPVLPDPDYGFKRLLDGRLFPRVRFIIDLGNKAAHTASPVSRAQAVEALHCLYDFTLWVGWSYAEAIPYGTL
jgi:hypothetical protein